PEGMRDIEITAANLVVGTPQYMSPEQCSQSGPIDSRSDIYSLGVIIFEMLAGRVPFTGESPTVIMMKHVQEPPPSLLKVRSDLPPTVQFPRLTPGGSCYLPQSFWSQFSESYFCLRGARSKRPGSRDRAAW